MIIASILAVLAFAALCFIIRSQRDEIRELRADNQRLLSRIGYDYGFALHNASARVYTPEPQPDLDFPSPGAFFAMRKPPPLDLKKES